MKRVLLVEDDLQIRRVISLFFQLEDIECVTVESGEAGLEWLEKDPNFCCVLLDHMLPDISGSELYRELKRRSSDHPPVVFMSADPEIDRKLQGFGPTRILRKPFEISDLLKTLEPANSAHS